MPNALCFILSRRTRLMSLDRQRESWRRSSATWTGRRVRSYRCSPRTHSPAVTPTPWSNSSPLTPPLSATPPFSPLRPHRSLRPLRPPFLPLRARRFSSLSLALVYAAVGVLAVAWSTAGGAVLCFQVVGCGISSRRF